MRVPELSEIFAYRLTAEDQIGFFRCMTELIDIEEKLKKEGDLDYVKSHSDRAEKIRILFQWIEDNPVQFYALGFQPAFQPFTLEAAKLYGIAKNLNSLEALGVEVKS